MSQLGSEECSFERSASDVLVPAPVPFVYGAIADHGGVLLPALAIFLVDRIRLLESIVLLLELLRKIFVDVQD